MTTENPAWISGCCYPDCQDFPEDGELFCSSHAQRLDPDTRARLRGLLVTCRKSRRPPLDVVRAVKDAIGQIQPRGGR